MKTDLNLLLECLKYQMDNPDSQKEVLVTIYSVCQQNSDASDYFREIGGLMLISNLAKSSAYSIVKEAALFTLGALAESNVYCQQILCTSDLFSEVILASSNKDSSLNLKRMSVYVMLVLISNNKAGQTLARETGCIDILLQLFRETLSISEMDQSHEESSSCYQLWASVCSTLCACTNNPQNDDNQKKCCTAFPYANKWLQNISSPEIVRPICSFIGLTVANNTPVQEYFAHVGGLDTLAGLLVKLVDDSHISTSSAKLAVVVTKTLDACIAENSAVGIVLSKYHIVSSLMKLLLHESMSTGDKFSIILTLGHCTDDCEENQYDLLKNNGLPLMIQLLTESQDEELNKAVTFVLQNCKKITEDLSLRLNEKSSDMKDPSSPMDKQGKAMHKDDHWKKAKEILQRIQMLERQHEEDLKESFQTMETLNSNKKNSDFGIEKIMCHPQPEPMGESSITLNDRLRRRPSFSQWFAERNKEIFTNSKEGKTNDSFKNIRQELCTSTAKEDGTLRDGQLMERVRRQIFVDEDANQESVKENNVAHLKVKASDELNTVLRKLPSSQSEALLCSPLVSRNISNSVLENDPINTSKTKDTEIQSNVPKLIHKLNEVDNNTNEEHICEAVCSPNTSEHAFKHPAPVPKNKKQRAYIDPFILCPDIIDTEICSIVSTSTPANLRCSGCRPLGTYLNSRNICKILQRCPYQCDRHKVILEAEESYKRELRKSITYENDSSAAYKNFTSTFGGGCSSGLRGDIASRGCCAGFPLEFGSEAYSWYRLEKEWILCRACEKNTVLSRSFIVYFALRLRMPREALQIKPKTPKKVFQ
ncbi:telomere repeats-binding bouquet formation protein 1 isoform X2 [Lissotriton helveticus]